MALPLIAATLLLSLVQSTGASIEGIVVRIGTGEPIAGAEVKLTRVAGPSDVVATASDESAGEVMPPNPFPSTISDRNGTFVLKDLKAGSYRITAARNGYSKQEYGQRIPGAQGTVVSVTPGQTIKDVTFHLTPAGNVAGQVRDSGGEPLTGFQVLLLRSAYNSDGRRTFETVGSARTDDRGEYRFYWITPGRYYLSAGLGNGPNENSGWRNANEVPAKPYPMTYYPGTTDPSKASVVELAPGVELSAIDFVLPRLDLYRIRGKLLDAATGKPPNHVEVMILPRDPFGPFNTSQLNFSNYNPINGTFELRDVAPGSYWISATTAPDVDTPIAPNAIPRTATDLFMALITSRRKAQTAVDIFGADIDNVALTLTSGFSVLGRLSVDDHELSAIKGFENIQVTLTSTTPNNELFPRPIAPDGMFSLNNVLPGEYRLHVRLPQPEMYVKEARLGPVDLLNGPLLISGPVSDTLDIVLSSKSGQIDGTLLNEKAQPVAGTQAVLIPNRFRDRADLYRTAVTDREGHFTIRGITPGEYKVFAWEAIEQFAYFDANLIQQYEQKSVAVSISESSKVTVEVNVIPAAQ